MKILLKEALIYDGSEKPCYNANILVENDKIKYIGEKDNFKVDKIINCKDKIVTPGFIDVHAHSELRLATLSNDMCDKVNQGITTEISGNCGIGCFPINSDSRFLVKDHVKDVLGNYNLNWNWTDFNSFSSYIKNKGMSYNMAFLTAHSPLRYAVLKDDIKREATKKEVEKMCYLLDESLKQGSVGLSTGLYYSPCLYASRYEIKELLKVVKDNNKYFTTHHRCEGGDNIISSLKEILDLALETKVKLEISHLKVIGLKYQDKVDEVLKLIYEYRDKGLDVAFDQYPYNYGSTSLYSLLPPSVLGNSRENIAKILKDKKNREAIKKEILEGKDFDSIIKLCNFDNIKILTSESFPSYNNQTISSLAKKEKSDPFDFLFEVLIKEKGSVLMQDITQSKESIIKILKDPLCVFGSDALYSGEVFHPRSYYASLERLQYSDKINLEFLISRMTGISAKRFNLKNIGFIKEGYNADLLVIDFNKFSTTNTKAIEYVIINGVIVKDNNEFINKDCGRVIYNT